VKIRRQEIRRRFIMVDRKLLLFSAVLLIAGEVLYQVAQYFHAGEGATTVKGGFTVYAHSAPWAIVHAAQFASSAILISVFWPCSSLSVSTPESGQ
jgi:hypothetical protein